MADESDEVPNLKGKTYSDFYLRKRDWDKLELMHEVLKVCLPLTLIFLSILTSRLIAKEPASAKQTFSSSKEPSAFRTIPVLEYLKETWRNMANHPKFSEVENSIHKGIENLNKWYNKVNDTDAYFICLCMCLCNFIPITRDLLTLGFTVLDPNVKNAYALDKWDAESYAAGMVQLEIVVRSCFFI